MTDADLQSEYQRQVGLLGPEEFQLRHLLVAEEATAKLLIDRIKAGAIMASLSQEFSREESTKAQGGLNPWTPQGELLPTVREAVQPLRQGQLVQTPVRSQQGWHVVEVKDRRPYQAPAIDTVRQQLIQAIAQQRLQARVEALRQAAKVE